MRILLIEDDDLIGDGIKTGLGSMGFFVDWILDGKTALNAPALGVYDAIILDLTLPGVDGLTLLHGWRMAGNTAPVLVLTARDAITQRVEGLNKGADDYMGKPFALDELAARLRALLRRSTGSLEPLLRHGDVTLDPNTRVVKKGEYEIEFGPKEMALLELFMRSGQRVLPRSVIEEKLYTWDDSISSNTVEVFVHHLRRKLGSGFIRTISRVGYALGGEDDI